MTTELDTDLFLDDDPTRRVKGALAPVLFIAGTKGGVGATTVALVAAEMSRAGGQVERVVLFDADPTNSHVATYIRASAKASPPIPTVTTGVLVRDPRAAVVGPDRINAGHSPGVPDISFASVLAPGSSQYDPFAGSAQAYTSTLRAVRERADLVIIDIGTLNPDHPSALQESFAYPVMRSGGWLLLVSNTTQPAIRSAMTTARTLAKAEVVPRERLFTLVNARRAGVAADRLKAMTERIGAFSTVIGTVDYDEAGIGDRLESGHLPSEHPTLVPALAELLFVMTGRPAFGVLASGKSLDGTSGGHSGGGLRSRLPSLTGRRRD